MTNNTAELAVELAFRAYNQGNLALAEEKARQALYLQENIPDAVFLLGLIAKQAGALDNAEDLLYQAHYTCPENKQYALAFASLLQQRGKIRQALDLFLKFKDDVAVLTQIGYIYLNLQEDSFAKSAFQQAIKKDPYCSDALTGLAVLEKKARHFKKYLQLLQQASEHPTAEVWYQWAIYYQQQKYFKRALTAINKALSLRQNDWFYIKQGEILEDLRQWKKAETAYQNALEINQYQAQALKNLGVIYWRKRDLSRAEEYYQKALDCGNPSVELLYDMAVLLYATNRKPKALDFYKEALRQNPTHFPSLYNLACILEQVGDWQEAVGLYFNILVLYPKTEKICWRIVNCLQHIYAAGDTKLARDFAKGWALNFKQDIVAQFTYLVFQGKRPNAEMVRKYMRLFYQDFSADYESQMKKINAQSVDKLLHLLPKKTFANVLDIGCGTGAFGKMFKNKVKHITGIDMAPAMLEKAKKYYHTVRNTDTLLYLKKHTGFDLIVAADVFCCFDNPEEVINAVGLALQTGGIFAFTIENTDKKQDNINYMGRFEQNPNRIASVLEKAGFDIQHRTDCVLRTENGIDVKGTAFVAVKK